MDVEESDEAFTETLSLKKEEDDLLDPSDPALDNVISLVEETDVASGEVDLEAGPSGISTIQITDEALNEEGENVVYYIQDSKEDLNQHQVDTIQEDSQINFLIDSDLLQLKQKSSTSKPCQAVSFWTKKMSVDFFKECNKRLDQFKDPYVKRSQLYGDIAAALCGLGYNVDAGDISRKWRNLKARFARVHNVKMYFKREYVTWTYYDDVYKILEYLEDPLVTKSEPHPPYNGYKKQYMFRPPSPQPADPPKFQVDIDYLWKFQSLPIITSLYELGEPLLLTNFNARDKSPTSDRKFSQKKLLMKEVRRKQEKYIKTRVERNIQLKKIAMALKSSNKAMKKRSAALAKLTSAIMRGNSNTQPSPPMTGLHV